MYRFFSLILVLSTLGACAQSTSEGARTDLSVNEVSELIKSNKELVVIDVRTPDEYNQGHIEGAQHMNIYDADFEERLKALDKDVEYVVYCRSGGRSGKAAGMMETMGFSNFHNMKGGMLAWSKASLPTQN